MHFTDLQPFIHTHTHLHACMLTPTLCCIEYTPIKQHAYQQFHTHAVSHANLQFSMHINLHILAGLHTCRLAHTDSFTLKLICTQICLHACTHVQSCALTHMGMQLHKMHTHIIVCTLVYIHLYVHSGILTYAYALANIQKTGNIFTTACIMVVKLNSVNTSFWLATLHSVPLQQPPCRSSEWGFNYAGLFLQQL